MFRSALGRPVSLTTSAVYRSSLSVINSRIYSRGIHGNGSPHTVSQVLLGGATPVRGRGGLAFLRLNRSFPSVRDLSSEIPPTSTSPEDNSNSVENPPLEGTDSQPTKALDSENQVDESVVEFTPEAEPTSEVEVTEEADSTADSESTPLVPALEKKKRMSREEIKASKKSVRKAEKVAEKQARKAAKKATAKAEAEAKTAELVAQGIDPTIPPAPEEVKPSNHKANKAQKKSTKGAEKFSKGKGAENDKSADDAPPESRHARRGSTAIQPVTTVAAKRIVITNVDDSNSDAPRVSHGLDRVLFNPGVHYIQDPASRVYNFDPYLEKIMPIKEFEFGNTMRYVKPSDDESLHSMAKNNGMRYLSSSSNMTGLLEQLHYLISSWRPLQLSRMSGEFDVQSRKPTMIARSAAVVNLRWKDGIYAIDKAKDLELDHPTILSMFGNLLEKALISPPDEFEKYRKGSVEKPSANVPDGYLYSGYGGLLWRSQLDAMDPRLPGTGVFDLKTRAVVSLRFHNADYERGLGYELFRNTGNWMSYEREYHDMARATMLKYLLQVRLGRMDGIMVAYHNIERLFGFQYLNLGEMDYIQHGQSSPELGDQEFRTSLHLMNEALDHITKRFPNQTVQISFETREATVPFTYIFAEPIDDADLDNIDRIMSKRDRRFQASVLGDEPLPEDMEGTIEETKDSDGSWQKMKDVVDMEIQQDGLVTDGSEPDLNTALADALVESRSAKILADTLQNVFAGDVTLSGSADVEKGEGEENVKDMPADEVLSLVSELRTKTDRLAVTLEKLQDLIEGQPDEISSLARRLIKHIPGQVRTQAQLLVEIKPQLDELEKTASEESDWDNVEERDQEIDNDKTEIKLNEEAQAEVIEETEGEEASAATETDTDVDPSNVETAAESSTETVSARSISKAKKIKMERAAAAANLPPLFAMVLTTRNRVDGAYTERPKNLNGESDWKVEYCFSEITDPATAWRNFNMLKSRRNKALDKRGGDDWFLDMIANRVEQSKAIRKKRDDAEAKERETLKENGEEFSDRPVVFEPFYKGRPSGSNMSMVTEAKKVDSEN